MPPLRDLLDAVRSLPVQEKIVSPPDIPHVDVSSAAVSQAAAFTTPSASSPSDPDNARKHFFIAAGDFCALSFAAGCTRDPAAWCALYLTLWGGLQELPPSESGMTRIPPPSGEALQACAALLSAGKAEEAASAAVRFMPESPFCLDAQRVLDIALTECGAPWNAARALSRQEVRALLGRLPGVEKLCFNDGTPFADPATALWLGSLASGDESPAAAPVLSPQADEDSVREALREADRLAASQSGAERALDLLQAAREALGAEGAKGFPLLLKEADILMRCQHWAAATAVAEHIEETVLHHDLPAWDGQSALEGLTAAYTAWSGLGGEEAQRRARTLMVKIARLRPARVLALTIG